MYQVNHTVLFPLLRNDDVPNVIITIKVSRIGQKAGFFLLRALKPEKAIFRRPSHFAMRIMIPVLLGASLGIVSCKEVAESHMKEMVQMRDSVFKNYPSVAAVTINVQDNKRIIFTFGSRKLAGAGEAQRQQMAAELGAMTLRMFGKNSGIEEEKLIITPDEQNDQAEPADGIVTTFNIDSLARTIQR